jgi:hypothetical protein
MMINDICHYLSENDDRYEYARFCNSDTQIPLTLNRSNLNIGKYRKKSYEDV